MLSKKLWHSFLIILSYLLFSAGVATGFSLLCASWTKTWWILIIIGILFWTASLVFTAKSLDYPMLRVPAVVTNAIGLGFFIATYTVGMGLALPPVFHFTLAFVCALLYLLLMALFTVPVLKGYLWYTIVAYLVWLAGGIICAGIFLFPHVFSWLGIPIPEQFGMFVFFYLLMLGFLAVGSLCPAEEFSDVLFLTLAPALLASFIVFVVVLLALAGCDSCDCDGGCCDCAEGCSGGHYDPTRYEKKQKLKQALSTLSDLN